ncbi:MAG TPA: 2TM domain-containing protein [Candidatus Alistipes excrementipullorum]|nr:2TM domain-containing protein [Candidatus Alistipes excrementipullorum]
MEERNTRLSAEELAKRRKTVIRHTATFIVICTFLSIMNSVTTPSYPWVLWVAGCWGGGCSAAMDILSAGLLNPKT